MVSPPVAVDSVSCTAFCTVSPVGVSRRISAVAKFLLLVRSVAVKVMRAVSVPVKAEAPLLSGRKIASPAVTVWSAMPGAGTMVVGAPATVEIAEKFPDALQADVLGQLWRINAAGWPKFEFTKAVTPPRCGLGRLLIVS